jgi:hypothetical protein
MQARGLLVISPRVDYPRDSFLGDGVGGMASGRLLLLVVSYTMRAKASTKKRMTNDERLSLENIL